MKLSKHTQFAVWRMSYPDPSQKRFAVMVDGIPTGVTMVNEIDDHGGEINITFLAGGRSYDRLWDALKAAGHEIEEEI